MRTLALALLLVAQTTAADRLPEPPRAPVVARLLKIEVLGDGIAATAGAGTQQGVDRRDACALIDANDKPITASCSIIRVNKTTTVVKTSMTQDEIKRDLPRVRFTAP